MLKPILKTPKNAMVTFCESRKDFGGENNAHILRSKSPTPRHAIVQTNVSLTPIDSGVVSIIKKESNLVELNILQHSEAPVWRKLFSSNMTEFQQSHENENSNFSSLNQPELLKLHSKLLIDKENLSTNLFVSRASLLIERLTDRFWRKVLEV